MIQVNDYTNTMYITTPPDAECLRIFISGPMSGYVNYNSDRFLYFEEELSKLDWFVINPWHNGVARDEPFYVHLRKDFEMLLDADAIFSLNGWEESAGATMEYLVARNSGMPQFFENEGKLPNGEDFNKDYLKLLNRSQHIPRPIYRGIINAESTKIFQEHTETS